MLHIVRYFVGMMFVHRKRHIGAEAINVIHGRAGKRAVAAWTRGSPQDY